MGTLMLKDHNEAFRCPLMGEHDTFDSVWRVGPGKDAATLALEDTSCSYCGSLHPMAFMEGLESGKYLLGACDKNYKVYVDRVDGQKMGSIKFYFQHLSEKQQQRFVDLLNSQRLRFSSGTGFYVLPFFCAPKKPGDV